VGSALAGPQVAEVVAVTGAVCKCEHPFYAHHGPQGPCIAVVSTAEKQPKALGGKVSAGSVCPCQKYAEKR
jgi:hypothetical protein